METTKYFFKRVRKSGNNSIKIGIIILIILVIFALAGFASPKFFKRTVFGVAAPLWNEEGKLRAIFSEFIDLLNSKSDLVIENKKLKGRVEELEASLRSKDLMLQSNSDALRELGRITEASEPKGVIAQVLKRPPSVPYDILLIDRGSESGLSIGDFVLTKGNTAIGKLYDVFSNSSKVVLFSSPGLKSEVVVGEKIINAQALGRGGGVFHVELPREVAVLEGDGVYLLDTPVIFLGNIMQVFKEPADPFQIAIFRTPQNISELKWVRVLNMEDVAILEDTEELFTSSTTPQL